MQQLRLIVSRLKCPCKGCLCKSCHYTAFVRNVSHYVRDLCLQDSFRARCSTSGLSAAHLRVREMSTCEMSVSRMSMCGMSVFIQNFHEIYVSFKMSACCMSVCKNSVLR